MTGDNKVSQYIAEDGYETQLKPPRTFIHTIPIRNTRKMLTDDKVVLLEL